MTGRPVMLDSASPAMNVAGRRMRLHAFVVLALTLVAGLALGWGLAHRVGQASRLAAAGPGATRAPTRGGGPQRPNMKAQLGLTDAQCSAIDSVFASRRSQIDAFWRGPGSQLRAILDSTGADVRAVLDSGQRVKLDEINAKRRHRGDGRGPEGRGPDGRGRFCGGRDAGPAASKDTARR